MAPVDFRRKSYGRTMAHPFFHNEEWEAESFEKCDAKITVEYMQDYDVIPFIINFTFATRLNSVSTGPGHKHPI